MAAETARRYSRAMGLSRWLRVTGTSGQASRTISPTRRSWLPFTTDQSRQTATASTPSLRKSSTAARTSSSSSAVCSAPVASIRPRTPRVRIRGTKGSG